MTLENRIRLYSVMVILFPVIVAIIAVALGMSAESPAATPLMGFSLLGSAGFFIQAFRLERRKNRL